MRKGEELEREDERKGRNVRESRKRDRVMMKAGSERRMDLEPAESRAWSTYNT